MSDPELQIVESEAEAARVVAELLAAAARSGAEIALTGGSTPRQAYELTAGLEPDWSRAGVWWGDERCVPPDDELSNYLILLGLGPDGHVASLFPNAPSLEERDRLVVSAPAQLEPFIDRVTLTLPALCAGNEVVFLVTGGDKADAVGRAFASPPGPETPASLVRSTEGRTLVVLDAAAASKLPG